MATTMSVPYHARRHKRQETLIPYVLLWVSFFLISILFSSTLWGQACQRLILPHNPALGKYNPDSVMIDTCTQKIHSKKCLTVTFSIDYFSISASPRSSVIYRTWNQLDSALVSLRNSLKKVEDSLGYYRFRKIYPDIVDTSSLASKTFSIEFTAYQDITKVESLFQSIPGIRGTAFIPNYYESTVSSGYSIVPSNHENGDVPNLEMHIGMFSNEQLHAIYDTYQGHNKLGIAWNHRKMRVPLAWEITKGSDNVVFIHLDPHIGTDNNVLGMHSLETVSTNTCRSGDMVEKIQRKNNGQTTILNNTGNLIYNEKFDANSWVPDPGSGNISPQHLVSAVHPLNGATNFNARENNKGLIGVAPGCKLIGLSNWPKDINGNSAFDVDPSTAGIQHADGMYYIGSVADSPEASNTLDVGMVVSHSAEERSFTALRSDNLNGARDGFSITTLGLAGWDDGWLSNPSVIPNDCRLAHNDVICNNTLPWDIKQSIEMIPDFKFYYDGVESRDYTSLCANNVEQGNNLVWSPFLNNKRKALALAIVVPNDLWTASYGGYAKLSAPSYHTSQLSAVVALMKSVDKNLGVSTPTSNKALIQQQAHDIVTYTARKIDVSKTLVKTWFASLDDLVMFTDEYKIAEPNHTNQLHPNYITSINGFNAALDPLARSYSHNAGFGMLDAFRCVAHAIPHKPNGSTSNVKYRYEGNNPLDWANAVILNTTSHPLNVVNRKVLHLGKYYDENTELLGVTSWHKGGHVFREGTIQEPFYKNGNGKTIVNINLSVGESTGDEQVLAIDGILTSEETGKKISTSGTGKILATGYLDNVTYEGNVKLSDLKVIAEETKAGGLDFKAPANKQAEIYGEVELHEFAFMNCSSGKTVIRPGGIVRMKGAKDIIVKSGAVLEMDYASEVYSDIKQGDKRLRKIIIENGGTLRIPEKSRAVILDCIVEVKEGGLFVMERGAGAKLYKLVVDPKGTFVMEHGLTAAPQNSPNAALDGPYLILDNKEDHIVNGHFLVGTAVKNVQNNYEHWSSAGGLHPNLPSAELTQVKKPWIMGPVNYCGEPEGIATIKSTYDMRTIPDKSPSLFTALNRSELQASFKVQNARFLNAVIDIQNTHTADIKWCEFSADGAHANDVAKALISMDYPSSAVLRRNFGNKRRIGISEFEAVSGKLIMSNNELFDRKSYIRGDSVRPPKNGATDTYTGAPELTLENHKIDGIRIRRLSNFIMHNNVFRYCLNGLHYTGTFFDVHDNRFISCASGTFSHDGGKFCSNKFTRCQKSLDLLNSSTQNLTNNTFMEAGVGIWVGGGSQVHIKGNTFDKYYHGIKIANSSVNLSGIYTIVPGTNEADRIKIGHNSFGHGAFTNIEDFRKNSSQFARMATNISDINFTNRFDGADMRCGKNIMTEVNATYHLFKEQENGVNVPLRRTVVVKRNDWNHSSLVHSPIRNIIAGTPPIAQVPIAELEQLDEGELSPSCDIETERQTCFVPSAVINPKDPPHHPYDPPNGIIMYQDSLPNNGDLPNRKQDTLYIKGFFSNAYHFSIRTIFPDWFRKQKIYDATQSALLHSHDTVRIDSLLYRLKHISADTSEDTLVRIASWVNIAKIHEFRGHDDSTFLAYSAIMTNYPTMPDAKFALWQRNFIAARLLDPSFGTVYQNAMNYAYQQDVLGRLGIVGSGSPKFSAPLSGIVPENNSLILHQNVPNPFGDETNISFTCYLPIRAKISIVTLTGTPVWSSDFKEYGAGYHAIPITLHNLSAGTYFYRLETDMETLVKQMILVK